MRQDIINNEPQERQAYVPASVKVITTSVQKVICTSPNNVYNPWGGDEEDI